jgi:ATPase subunit of ABC transporter with duplicated ATPase domains
VGLLVSHDRELLDALCGQCLFVEPPGASMRPGGYTDASALARADEEHARHEHRSAKRELGRLQLEASDRRREAARATQRHSKRRLPRKDHDAKSRIDLARITGKDIKSGQRLRQLDGRLRQARDKLARIRVKKHRRLRLEVNASQARRDRLFRLPAGSIALGGGRRLDHPELQMAPGDRVAVVGPNGSGKSTLIREIVGCLDVPAERVVYLAQEIDRFTGAKAAADVRRLSHEQLGEVMTTVACLGSEPERVLETDEPSPGELRKIMLAVGMAGDPQLIVMDEPTNHLDLPSIECMERALDGCPCGLLLVSHDTRFLTRLSQTVWEISADAEDPDATRLVTRPAKYLDQQSC